MSFPGISRVLNGFKVGEDTDSLQTPIKKQNKKNQRRKPNAKYNKTRAVGVRKPCRSYSNGVALGRDKNQWWENTGSFLEEEGFPTFPCREGPLGTPSP